MHKFQILVLVIGVVFLTGCAALERIAPSALDDQGKPIPGTHELTDQAKAVSSNLGVYGELAVGIPLLVWNFVERFRRKKNNQGLVSTVIALKDAADDPDTKAAFEKIKGKLKSAHKVAGVNSEIKSILAKL